MRALMDERGVITLQGETPMEAWALHAWGERAWVLKDDTLRAESGHWRGSMLIVDAGKPEGGAA